jgi:hypothetical protein
VELLWCHLNQSDRASPIRRCRSWWVTLGDHDGDVKCAKLNRIQKKKLQPKSAGEPFRPLEVERQGQLRYCEMGKCREMYERRRSVRKKNGTSAH